MAANSQIHPELARLIETGDAARALLGRDLGNLRRRLSLPGQMIHAAQSVRQHPVAWCGGLFGVGLVVAGLLRRRSVPARKSRGFRGLVLGLVVTAARPVVKTWLAAQLKQFLAATPQVPPRPAVISANSSFPTYH